MRLAFECLTDDLEYIQPLADFDFILADQVLKDKKYADFYRKSTRYKILDNSTNELLVPVSISQLKEAADIVHPDLVVAPDYLGDSVKTLDSLSDMCLEFPMDEILPVVQGNSLREVNDCLQGIVSRHFFSVAVPYDITCSRTAPLFEMAEARKAVMRILSSNPTYYVNLYRIHLLGMTTLEELSYYKKEDLVESLDTGCPILHGLKGMRFGECELLPKNTPTLIQMEEGSDSYRSYTDTYFNIAFLRKVVNES